MKYHLKGEITISKNTNSNILKPNGADDRRDHVFPQTYITARERERERFWITYKSQVPMN
jgi:hypothetical protein